MIIQFPCEVVIIKTSSSKTDQLVIITVSSQQNESRMVELFDALDQSPGNADTRYNNYDVQ